MNTNILNKIEQLIIQTNKTIESLKDDNDLSSAKSYGFKLNSFRKAHKNIKCIDFKITSTDQLKNIKGIGKGIISRIEEIITTGELKELNSDADANDTSYKQIQNLQRITGIGPSNAKKMFNDGITLEKLLDTDISDSKNPLISKLTHHQLLGLKYFHDLEKRIPRKEIMSIEKKLKKYCNQIDTKLGLIICGSYRREAKDSGDIDMLLYSNNLENLDYTLKDVIDYLTEKGLIVDDLTINGNTKYMGFCRNTPKSLARRIDIRLISKDSLAPAMLYFTGSGDFNKNMRTYALKKGYTINEYSIFKINKSKKKFEISVDSEEDIFKILDIPYYHPKDRLASVHFE